MPLQLNQSIKTSVPSVPSVSTPVRSNHYVKQVSTPSAASFHARSNKAEVVVEHVGSKMIGKKVNETTRAPIIQFKSAMKPYKYMYQTLYKRALGILKSFTVVFLEIFCSNLFSITYFSYEYASRRN